MKNTLKIFATTSFLIFLCSSCSVEENQNGVERSTENTSEAKSLNLDKEQTYIASTAPSTKSGCKYKW